MNTQSLRILLADDDSPYCVLLQKYLTGHGHSVVVCNSGQEVFNILQKESFNLVLLDYKMEGINGINVLQWIYGREMDIPVILITGYGSDELLEEAFKWGASEYFIKGEMDVVSLPAMVERVWNGYQAQKK